MTDLGPLLTHRICLIGDCDGLIACRHLCEKHYRRWRRYGDPTYIPPLPPQCRPRDPISRFWAKVEKTDTCWNWTGALTGSGYGAFRVNNILTLVHRFSYEYLVGPIPKEMVIDHLCRNTACVNPDHLEPVTTRVNLLRGATLAAANAAKTHCPQGHPYDEENTHRHRFGRACKACNRDSCERQRRAKGILPISNFCPQGHEFTKENTRLKDGKWRICIQCARNDVIRRRAIKKGLK